MLAELLHGQLAVLPQHQHHQVLRVGEPEVLQDHAVDAVEGAGGGVQGEADLLVEAEEVLVRAGARGGSGRVVAVMPPGYLLQPFSCAQLNCVL